MRVIACHFSHVALLSFAPAFAAASSEHQGCLSWDSGFCEQALDEPVAHLQVNSIVTKRGKKKPKRLQPEDAHAKLAASPDARDAVTPQKPQVPVVAAKATSPSKEPSVSASVPAIVPKDAKVSSSSLEAQSAPDADGSTLEADDEGAEDDEESSSDASLAEEDSSKTGGSAKPVDPQDVKSAKAPYSLLQVEDDPMVRRADAADGASIFFESIAGITLGLLGHGDGVTKLSFKHRLFGRLTAFLLVTAMLLLMVILIKVFFSERGTRSIPGVMQKSGKTITHQYVAAVPRTSALEVERLLPGPPGDDCLKAGAVMRPMTSQQLLRLEVRVEGPLTGNTLTSPLTRQDCVAFSASVWKHAQDPESTRTAAVAFQTLGVDFDVVLLDAPHVRIVVRGEDVSLFEMQHGPHNERQALATAPEHWKDFVVSHQTIGPERGSAEFMPGVLVGSDFEFTESVLTLGATVTLVGELCRSASGRLSLRPWNGDADEEAIPARDAWRTSWECLGCPGKEKGAEKDDDPESTTPRSQADQDMTIHPGDEEPGAASLPEADRGKVLISDDPALFSGVAKAAAAAAAATAAAAAAAVKQPNEPLIRAWLGQLMGKR